MDNITQSGELESPWEKNKIMFLFQCAEERVMLFDKAKKERIKKAL